MAKREREREIDKCTVLHDRAKLDLINMKNAANVTIAHADDVARSVEARKSL